MLVVPAPSTFMALEGGPNDKQCPHIQFWTFVYLSWSLALFFPRGVFRIVKMSPSRGRFSISCPLTHMMVKAKWPGLSTYITFFPWFMGNMSLLTNMVICCLHSHFRNLHLLGAQPTLWHHALIWVLLWSYWRHVLSFWCIPTWPKTVTTTECSAWIRYWFLAILSWLIVSSFEELDEVCLSSGPAQVLP